MKKIYIIAILWIIVSMTAKNLQAEGTKEVMPTNAHGTGLIVSTIAAFPLGNVGSHRTASADQRLYFHIKDFTVENLYYGFRWSFLTIGAVGAPYADVYMRIYDPTGTIVALINLPNTGAGFINTYTEAITGPNIGGATPAGYNPLMFTPTQNGDYWVQFYRSSDGGVTPLPAGESMISPYFDMTVAETNNTQYTGRLHCNLWAFSVVDPVTFSQSAALSSQAIFYAYTKDSIVAKIDFQLGFRPLSFIIAFNDYGYQNTGNWLNDRRSVNSATLPALTNSYRVFLNTPDPAIYPVSPVPLAPTLVNPIIAGCPPGPYNVRFHAPQAGDYYILLDLNGVPGFQAASADRFFELISQPQGIISVAWDGLDGLGVPVPVNTSLPITFSFRKGRVNVPLYDVELNVNGFSVSGISPISQPNLPLYWNDTLLTNVGACPTNTANATGTGSRNDIVGQVSPGHAWNGNGNPTFAVPAPAVAGNDADNLQCNDFGNSRLINTWAWGIELYASQTLTLACVSVSGTVWDDGDNSAAGTFTNIQTGGELGTNAGGAIHAVLVDPLTGTSLSSAPVNADGTYTLSTCPIDAVGLKIIFSTTPGVFGIAAPAEGLPSDWLYTSPMNVTFNSGILDLTGFDFGVEKRPDSDPQTYTIGNPNLNDFITLNGAGGPMYPQPLSGLDFEDGVLGAAKTVVITQVPSNSELYYNGVLVTDNTSISNYDPNLMQVKFTVANIMNTSFQYAFVDLAGEQDLTPAIYMLQWAWLLPTKLTSFTASRQSQSILVKWTTTDETNTISFVVERSTDGRTFIPVAQLNGSSLNVVGKHSFTDNAPILNTTAYYRLKMVDVSGSKIYSSTVVVSYKMRPELEILPNPFKDHLILKMKLSTGGNVFVRLMNTKGMQVQKIKFVGNKGDNIFQVRNLAFLPRSVYYLQVVYEDKIIVQKVSNQ
ncbi:MAG: T9SS type A sorting domain-containing protein [Chitinophagaceae bacterium]|nr:T9SS type A sorting domain-containing protein [Chitinophagaceae bacterium]